MTTAPPPPHRIVALAIPAVVAFDLSIVAQLFGHPDERERYSFATSTAHPGTVPTSTGFGLRIDGGLELLDDADTVVVPGFHPMLEPGDENLDALRRAWDRGVRIASVCIGAFALAAAGLLDGRGATTHWQEADRFRAAFPRVRLDPDVLYVDEGRILTSAGLSAGIDLGLHMIRRDYGEAVAAAAARRMVVAAHRTGGQAQYIRRPLPSDGSLGETREWAVTELESALTVPRMARHAEMPVRSFTRQFQSETGMGPMQWLTAQRVREAARLLESTRLSIDDIALRSGLGSAGTLRMHFAREYGETPSAYRRARRAG